MWEWMYEGFWDKLEHFCYKLCREESRAEDLTQEVFLKALQNRELLDSFNQRQCKAWLFATARNLYCDQLRRKMKEESLMREMLPEGDEEPPDETAEAAWIWKRCWNCWPRWTGRCLRCVMKKAITPLS